MTQPTDPLLEARNALSDFEQVQHAQEQCVPCKLCGGEAIISDAGLGSGYYIKCSGSTTWREYKGCLINERRCSGWAYNVMNWWNRLHQTAALPHGELVEALRPFLRHDGLCGIVGGYGYCTCGFDAAIASFEKGAIEGA